MDLLRGDVCNPALICFVAFTRARGKIRSFKVTESCYEIYGSNRQNKLVEVYFNPITGDIVPSEVPKIPGAK